MRQKRLAAVLLLGATLSFCGCASVGPEKSTASPSERALPKPTNITINATLKLDLPAEVAKEANVPATAVGTLRLTVLATAIQACPPRSRFEGHVALTFSDPQGKRNYVDLSTDLQGEYTGVPNEGFFKAFEQLLQVIELFNQVPLGQAPGK